MGQEMTVNLESMSVAEIEELAKAIKKELPKRRKAEAKAAKIAEREALKAAKLAAQEEQKAAIAELKARAKELGIEATFNLKKLTAAGSDKRSKVAIKYASKSDPKNKWTGRGRKPAWVKEHINAGGKLEDLAV